MGNIKRHSTFPYLEFNFTDKNGAPIDCSGYSVRLLSMDKTKAVVINAVVGEPDSGAVWVDESKGEGEYHWKAADTATLGSYKYEFEFVRLADGAIFTLPDSGFFSYSVKEDIEAA